jgi:hypothetical protein
MNELKQYKNKMEFADHIHRLNNESNLGLSRTNILELLAMYDTYELELMKLEKQIEGCNQYSLAQAIMFVVLLKLSPELASLFLVLPIATLIIGLYLNKRSEIRPVFITQELENAIEQMTLNSMTEDSESDA